METLKGTTTVLNYRHRSANQPNPPLLLLLHGVGSNELALFELFQSVDPRFLLVSAQAPYPMGYDRYGWYEVDFSTSTPTINAEQAEKSRQILVQFINQLVEKYGANAQQVYLLGFSQGAIMSYALTLTRPDKVAGALVIGGRLLAQTKLAIAPPDKLSDTSLLIVHGEQDTKLPIHFAREARDFLTTLPLELCYQEYTAGHQITSDMLLDASQWFAEQLG